LSPKRNGEIDLNELEKTLNKDTLMVSLMHINNETGVLNDIESIGEICRKKNVIFHVDAAQSIGKISIDVGNLKVDLMSLASHKIYGPKGIGALYINGKTMGRIAPIIKGGGQERGIRPGTLPTHQIIGMAAAFRLAKQHMNNDLNHIRKCRALFLKSISHIKDAVVNTDEVSTFPGIISLCLPDLDAESIIFGMNTIALSKGSACTSDSDEPSHVLKSMGLSQEEIRGTIRISFGRYTTMNEVSIAAESLVKIVTHLKMIKGQ
jgi:cysteine desulfurase